MLDNLIFSLALLGFALVLGFALFQLWRKGAIDRSKAKEVLDADVAATKSAARKVVDAGKSLIIKLKG